MKALVIDDSELARQELKHLLKSYQNIEIVGEAENASDALQKIDLLKPDLLFLDIQMPDKDGFEMLQELTEIPEVIFTTAFDHYAMQAFDHNALDYLQKPIKKDRLEVAVEKASKSIRKKAEVQRKVLGKDHKVFVKDGEECWFIKLGEVRILEILGSYTKIYFQDRHPMIPRSLNYMEARLDSEIFFRANRQQIINLEYIERIVPWFSGTLKVHLQTGEEIEISRRQSIKFREIMSF